MSEDDITILAKVRPRFGPPGRLYYYQGNFYYPHVSGPAEKRVRRAVRKFLVGNAAKVAADRAHPSYLSPPELFEEQMETYGRVA